MAKDNILDKFYTNDDIADYCFTRAVDMTGYDGSSPLVEPSAGGGAFVRAFQKHGLDRFEAYDIAPESDGIIRQDFLCLDHGYDGSMCVGNPPFGHRSRLAIEFVKYTRLKSCASFGGKHNR